MSHHISTVFNQGMSFTAIVDSHTVNMDSQEDSSLESGASPKKLMLAALAGCTGIDVVSILNKMKVVFSEFSIDITARMTETHPKIYDHVKITYKIKLAEEDKPKMEKAVKLSEEKYCAVSAMFRTFAKLEVEIIYK
ncbi:MAG: OsmC family protein [Ferruginibacter sp.]|nr:OsmC family protein [Ferruginibacter sp.]